MAGGERLGLAMGVGDSLGSIQASAAGRAWWMGELESCCRVGEVCARGAAAPGPAPMLDGEREGVHCCQPRLRSPAGAAIAVGLAARCLGTAGDSAPKVRAGLRNTSRLSGNERYDRSPRSMRCTEDGSARGGEAEGEREGGAFKRDPRAEDEDAAGCCCGRPASPLRCALTDSAILARR